MLEYGGVRFKYNGERFLVYFRVSFFSGIRDVHVSIDPDRPVKPSMRDGLATNVESATPWVGERVKWALIRHWFRFWFRLKRRVERKFHQEHGNRIV